MTAPKPTAASLNLPYPLVFDGKDPKNPSSTLAHLDGIPTQFQKNPSTLPNQYVDVMANWFKPLLQNASDARGKRLLAAVNGWISGKKTAANKRLIVNEYTYVAGTVALGMTLKIGLANVGNQVQERVNGITEGTAQAVGDATKTLSSPLAALQYLFSAIFSVQFWIRVLEGLIALMLIGVGLSKIASGTALGDAAGKAVALPEKIATRQHASRRREAGTSASESRSRTAYWNSVSAKKRATKD